MTESLMITLVTQNGEKLPARRRNPHQPRKRFAVGDCVLA